LKEFAAKPGEARSSAKSGTKKLPARRSLGEGGRKSRPPWADFCPAHFSAWLASLINFWYSKAIRI